MELEQLIEDFQGFRCSFHDDDGAYIRGQIDEIYDDENITMASISDASGNTYVVEFDEIQKQTINDEPLN